MSIRTGATAPPTRAPDSADRVEFAPYGDWESDCPARLILDLFDNSWLLVIVYALRDGPLRTVQLRGAIGGISQKMLTQTLRRMERMALVERHRYPEAPPRVEYSLTPAGRDLLPPILALGAWVGRHGDTVRASMYGGDFDD
ncbi:winged helix-turn-helix transcriptional regulator [Nocardia otitidiscaviarum]|uniref:winged helix-turn-helix transcriptional regulator n=1 Tax=Nocardia otitidiscaviarum TaxID=1823 RepID=UPI002B4AF861|nr:helix-turn-helix domain-containing protein [Nocardia otitidiscaviarum]